jgi:hypothetical protein
VDSSMLWLVIAIAIAIVVAAGLWFALRQRRTRHLQARFGPEYDRMVVAEGNPRKAEATLEARARRVEALHIRPLTASDAARFDDAWRRVQSRFVDDPRAAVTEADLLVGEVMAARGYPVGDFEQRVADISVDHPDVVVNYRAAREIAGQHARGKASTEDLRQAMVHYRALFKDLLETTDGSGTRSDAEAIAARRH